MPRCEAPEPENMRCTDLYIECPRANGNKADWCVSTFLLLLETLDHRVFATTLESRSRWNQLTDDHVFHQTGEVIATALDGGIDKHASSVLEGCG